MVAFAFIYYDTILAHIPYALYASVLLFIFSYAEVSMLVRAIYY